MEDDLQSPILTPNSMLLGRKTATLEEYLDEDDEGNWKKDRGILQEAKMRPGKWSTLKLCENQMI